MSDYDAIYAAVRSRIQGGDIGEAVRDVLRQSFDISYVVPQIADSIRAAAIDIQEQATRPSVLFRPKVAPDGNRWCALYGPNLAEGVAGFGDSPAEAMADFDKSWIAKRGVTS